MVEPISSSPGFPRPPKEVGEVKVSSRNLQEGINELVKALKDLQTDSSLAENSRFLDQVHPHLLNLKGHVEHALKAKGKEDVHFEHLHDAAEILSTIFHHPLEIDGASKAPVSLAEAAETYASGQAVHSDLSKIFKSFTQYPDSTATLTKELEILSKDLNF